jgi:hypothetical protein
MGIYSHVLPVVQTASRRRYGARKGPLWYRRWCGPEAEGQSGLGGEIPWSDAARSEGLEPPPNLLIHSPPNIVCGERDRLGRRLAIADRVP